MSKNIDKLEQQMKEVYRRLIDLANAEPNWEKKMGILDAKMEVYKWFVDTELGMDEHLCPRCNDPVGDDWMRKYDDDTHRYHPLCLSIETGLCFQCWCNIGGDVHITNKLSGALYHYECLEKKQLIQFGKQLKLVD